MDKFIAHLIQDKSLIRQLYILKILLNSDEVKSSKDLSQDLKCTSRTIINDISQLKQTLPDNWDIISIKSKGYLLIQDFRSDFSQIIIPYLINSALYKIILSIFNRRYYSLEKWAQLLYQDKITLKKNLNKFSEVLNNFTLNFKFKTINLVGQELNIRYFYIMFFYNVQKYKEIFILDTNLEEKIKNIIRIYNVEIDYNLLTIIVNVSIRRIVNKHHISRNIDLFTKFDNFDFEYIILIVNELERFYNIKLAQNELNFFKNALLLISEWNTEDKSRITYYYYNAHKKTFDKNIHLFDMISSELNVSLKVKEKIKHDIFFRLHKIYMYHKYRFPVGGFENEFETINQEFSKGYKIIYSIICSWNKKKNNNKLTKNEIHYITYHILLIVQSNNNKKGLVLLSGSSALKKYIYDKLYHELGDFLILQPKSDCKDEFDIILTNYQIPNTQIANIKIPIIRISRITIQKDISNIRKFFSPFN